MGKKSGPSAPDPQATAAAQSQANKEAVQESAKVNRYNIFTPYGSSKWEQDTNSPEYQKYQQQMSDYNKQLDAYNKGGTNAPVYRFDNTRSATDANNVKAKEEAIRLGYRGNVNDANALNSFLSSSSTDTRTKPTMPTAPDALYNQRLVQTLTPDQQKMLDLQEQLGISLGGKASDIAKNLFKGDFNYNGISEVPTDFNATRKNAEDRVYQGLTRNMDKDFSRVEETLRQRLANQGLPTTGEAFDRELANYYKARNDTNLSASDKAYQYGATEAQNEYARSVGERNRQIAERLQLRTQPANELAAILQGSPAIGNAPQANQPNYQVQAPDVIGLYNQQYQGQLNQANQKAGKKGSTVGSLAGLGMAATTGGASAGWNPAGGSTGMLGGIY